MSYCVCVYGVQGIEQIKTLDFDEMKCHIVCVCVWRAGHRADQDSGL